MICRDLVFPMHLSKVHPPHVESAGNNCRSCSWSAPRPADTSVCMDKFFSPRSTADKASRALLDVGTVFAFMSDRQKNLCDHTDLRFLTIAGAYG